MKPTAFSFLVLGSFWICGSESFAQEPLSYSRHVRPFLAKYCLECHNTKAEKGGLSLETFKGMLAGSDKGEVLVPGKPDQSKLVTLMEGNAKPIMPPNSVRLRPSKKEIAQVRAWVAAGAKDDTGLVKATVPDIKPHRPVTPPVAAMTYSPGGRELVVARYKSLAFVDADQGNTLHSLEETAPITALAFSANGKYLAAAVGVPGTPASVHIYAVAGVLENVRKVADWPDLHQDAILGVAFSHDGKTLATCSYDSQVKLINIDALGQQAGPVVTLKEHSDAVYGLGFSHDNKLLATAGADRAVKVWNAGTGKLLYTLGEATDWLYCLAWSADDHLATGGVDKSIRIYQAGSSGGKLAQSVFAHEGPVLRLAYDDDGLVLYSLGQDRIAKAWDAQGMVERKVFERLPESALTLALRPGRPQFALGLYNGQVLGFAGDTGKALFAETEQPAKKKAPSAKKDKETAPKSKPEASKIVPAFGPRGSAIRVHIEGKHLGGIKEVVANAAGIKAIILSGESKETMIVADLQLAGKLFAGVYALELKGAEGSAGKVDFTVDLFPSMTEMEANDSPGAGQEVKLSRTIVGALNKAGDADFFRFRADKGHQVGVQMLTGTVGSKVDPYLHLVDAQGRLLAESEDGLLGYTFSEAGIYALGVRDREFRGGAGMHYRLHVGEVPVVSSIFPLGLQRDTEADIQLHGVFLGAGKVHVKTPANAALGSKVPLKLDTPLGAPLGLPSPVVGEFAEVLTSRRSSPAAPPQGTSDAGGQAAGLLAVGTVPVPGTANGFLHLPQQSDRWRFQAKKGERLVVEVEARRLGSSLDSVIEILDGSGLPVARATLRSLAKTHVTFRDHDSAQPNIRIEAWGELAVNDYIYVGSELLKINALPTHPDADCIFFSAGGKRLGHLDTTPTHVSVGLPMYKVAIHPPGAVFSPNGFPVITLYYRNDDGGPGYGRDSRLIFDPPQDGDYFVRIGDSRGQGGDDYPYRLTVRPPRPSFNVSFTPTNPSVPNGSAIPVTVTCERLDGYEGPIALRLENLPLGFSAPDSHIPAGENSTAFALYVNQRSTPAAPQPLKLVAEAVIAGQQIVKKVTGGIPTVIEPGDIVTTTEEPMVTLKPGGTVKLTVNIERRNGFKGRVPVDVRGLPHGVKVLDIGLNGILITERETRRTFVIYAEPWVQATEHPFVVLAKREGKNTEHAAKSVLLRVVR